MVEEPRGSAARLDPQKIDFPTDRVTVRQIRRANTRVFSLAALEKARADEIDLFAAHCFELNVAERSFAAAAGLPDPSPSTGRAEDVAALEEVYSAYGLSSGLHTTAQLVEEIEAAASRQGRSSSRG